MTPDELEAMHRRAMEECGNSERVSCIYVRAHPGPCWSPAWEKWGGLSRRCNRARVSQDPTTICIRAADHRGEHEGPDGKTWKRSPRESQRRAA